MAVAVEHREPAVFGGGRGDEGVGERDAVVAIAVFGEFAQGGHRRIGDGAVVSQDPQRVKLELDGEIFRARASGVEDLHPHYWRDSESIVSHCLLQQ